MRHGIVYESYGVRLRPVRMQDAAFIVQMRCAEGAVGRVGDTARDVSAQEEYLSKYFERENDYYFIIESLSGLPVGTIGLYDFKGAQAEWGRWIVRRDSFAALPSVMGIYNIAFEVLGLQKLVGKVVSSNTPVLSFHRKFGLTETRVEIASRLIGGVLADLVCFELQRADWAVLKEKNAKLARLAERQIR